MTGLIPEAHRPDRRLFAPRPPHGEGREGVGRDRGRRTREGGGARGGVRRTRICLVGGRDGDGDGRDSDNDGISGVDIGE